MEGGGGGCLLIFSTFRMGAYARWALIRDWVLICFYQIHILQRELAAVDGYDAYFTRFR